MFTAETNLAVQGFTLTAAERRRLRIALRFSTGLCLALVVAAASVRSAAALAALALIGAGAGWSARHPFDRVWNAAAGRLHRGPRVPPTPSRRRHGFKVAAIWIGAAAAMLAAGQVAAGLVLLGVLVVLCAVQTFTYLCVPSLVIATWERHVRPLRHPSTTTGGPR